MGGGHAKECPILRIHLVGLLKQIILGKPFQVIARRIKNDTDPPRAKARSSGPGGEFFGLPLFNLGTNPEILVACEPIDLWNATCIHDLKCFFVYYTVNLCESCSEVFLAKEYHPPAITVAIDVLEPSQFSISLVRLLASYADYFD